MKKLILKNIQALYGTYDKAPKKLRGVEMKTVPVIHDAWLACEDGRIADFGEMINFPGINDWKDLEVIDCSGKSVMPCFADSHTHLVYAGNRKQEFADRINGLTYEEIANRGGGILNSAKKLRETSEDDLFEQSKLRLKEIILQGTGSVEIKSGYGLNLESELKMLRVIRRLKNLNWIPIKVTFLGAHSIPAEYKNNKDGYVKLIIEEMIPEIAKENLADFIDVFCEKNYFDENDCRKIFETGRKHGLIPKIHAEQLSHTNGIKTAIECGAISADHLEFCNNDDILSMKESEIVPTILPGAAFFLNLPFPPARKIIDNNLALALASDFNPGSSPSGNMKLMMSIACIQYKLTPEESFNAATINSSYAMNLQNEVGSITQGKLANLIITKTINGIVSLPYNFGTDFIDTVLINGRRFG